MVGIGLIVTGVFILGLSALSFYFRDRAHAALPEWVIDHNKVENLYQVRRKHRNRQPAGLEQYYAPSLAPSSFTSIKQAQDRIDSIIASEVRRAAWDAPHRVRYVYPSLEKL